MTPWAGDGGAVDGRARRAVRREDGDDTGVTDGWSGGWSRRDETAGGLRVGWSGRETEGSGEQYDGGGGDVME